MEIAIRRGDLAPLRNVPYGGDDGSRESAFGCVPRDRSRLCTGARTGRNRSGTKSVMGYGKSVALVAQVLVVVSVGGCGGDGDAAPDGLDEFFNRSRSAICALQVTCGAMPDVATCLASGMENDVRELEAVRKSIAAGKVRYDAAHLDACLAPLEQSFAGPCTRSSLVGVPSSLSAMEACNKILTGASPAGTACAFPFECESRVCALNDPSCSPSRQCCPGTCAPTPVPIPEGGDCSAGPAQVCADGGVCIPIEGTARCVIPSKVAGAACDAAHPCAAPLFCAFDDSLRSGTCELGAGTDEPCSPISYGSCDDARDYCEKETALCTRLGAVGAACDPSLKNCLDHALCIDGLCVGRGSVGAACDPTTARACLGDLECSPQTHTCTFPTPAACPG